MTYTVYILYWAWRVDGRLHRRGVSMILTLLAMRLFRVWLGNGHGYRAR